MERTATHLWRNRVSVIFLVLTNFPQHTPASATTTTAAIILTVLDCQYQQ
jgi:hypothetical protein